ncbi:unnamed protein product [Prorocentrum cordatum]|uniref:CRAL-TRIO domain-containing protein n=1 Tax=Prorocentrum cordatum TaxID=2364126 RepID=A0ABN9V3M5_9DINO|nr:unnamed protein product [Polarella glacialis]
MSRWPDQAGEIMDILLPLLHESQKIWATVCLCALLSAVVFSSRKKGSDRNTRSAYCSSGRNDQEQHLDARLQWPTEAEQVNVKKLTDSLSPKERALLEASPPDVQHIVFLSRFLRGLATFDLALERLRETLAYREEHAEQIRRAREQIPQDSMEFDLDHVLHGESLKKGLRFIPQGSQDGCFVEVMCIRYIEFDRYLSWPVDDVLELMVSVLELYSVVLHNQSVKQHKMCQVFFVEDASGFPVSILFKPHLWLVQCRALLPLVKCYPEFLHRVLIFNASAGLKQFVAMFERIGKYWFKSWFPGQVSEAEFDHEMRKYDGKLKVLSVGDWEEVADLASLTIFEQWTLAVQLEDDRVAPGLVAPRSVQLRRGETLKWSIRSQGGGGQPLVAFLSRESRDGQGIRGESQLQVLSHDFGSGTFLAPCDGVAVLVLDNSAGWTALKDVHMQLEVQMPRDNKGRHADDCMHHSHGWTCFSCCTGRERAIVHKL